MYGNLGEIEEIAENLLRLLLKTYDLSYRDIVNIVPRHLVRDVIAYIIKKYGWRYTIKCEFEVEPHLIFLGARPPNVHVKRENLDKEYRRCLRMADEVLRISEIEELEKQCRDKIVLINGIKLIKITPKLFIDDAYLYILKNGKLVKNMKWRTLYEKYRRGTNNKFVKWIGRKLADSVLCLKLIEYGVML